MSGLEVPGRRAAETAAASKEAQEVIKRTQSLKKVYPQLTTDNFGEYKYKKLIEPLRTNGEYITEDQDEFLKDMNEVEKELENLGLSSFSYDKAKQEASGPADKGLFAGLERQIGIVQEGAAAGSLGSPNLEKLFSAQDQSGFDANMADNNIVQKAYLDSPDFKAAAQKVFDYIQAQRKKNVGTLQKDTIQNYLEEIFNSDQDKLDSAMENSNIIKITALSDKQKSKVREGYAKYHLYRKRLEDRLKLGDKMKEERETVLTKPLEYAKSGERYVAEKIQTMRDHWASMDGKERTIAGLTILIGTAYFLNSENEGVQKTKDALMKAGLLALGYVGINTTSKVLLGKNLSTITGEYIEDKSGKRDFLKTVFDTDKAGADNMQASLVAIGNHDFMWLADQYENEEARCKATFVPENLRGIAVGGVAESQMSPNKIYLAMKLLDKKLQKKNTSIARLNEELKNANFEAKAAGKDFVPPTWAMILTAVCEDKEFGYTFDEKGKIKVDATKKIDTIWESYNRKRTGMWWPLTGRPKDWLKSIIDNEAKEDFNDNRLKHLSSTLIPESRPLSDVITDDNMGRFSKGFNNLFTDAYKKDKQFNAFEATDERALYITSTVKVDDSQTYPNRNKARLAAIESAHKLAIAEMNKDARFKGKEAQITQFVQPVFGTFVGPSKDGAKEYVMFLRAPLPESVEFKLKSSNEWPEGNMMQQMHEKPLSTGDTLTSADFKVLASGELPEFYKSFGPDYPALKMFKSNFGGAYESFLSRVKLRKDEQDEITKVLTYYSRQFANSGITKAGLVRYLATHDFTDKEIKEARGLKEEDKIPNDGLNVYELIKEATKDAKILENTPANKGHIFASLGTMVIMACNGDSGALDNINRISPDLGHKINIFIIPAPAPRTAADLKDVLTEYRKVIEAVYNSNHYTSAPQKKKIEEVANEYFQS